MYAQPSEMGARSYMYGSSSAADTRPVHRNQRSGHKLPKRRKYNESRVSNKSATSYGSYGSYNSSELNNTRRRIEYREGYKKKKKTSICTPCCLGVLGLLLLLALLAHDAVSARVDEAADADVVAHLELGDLAADLDDFAEELVTRHEGVAR